MIELPGDIDQSPSKEEPYAYLQGIRADTRDDLAKLSTNESKEFNLQRFITTLGEGEDPNKGYDIYDEVFIGIAGFELSSNSDENLKAVYKHWLNKEPYPGHEAGLREFKKWKDDMNNGRSRPASVLRKALVLQRTACNPDGKVPINWLEDAPFELIHQTYDSLLSGETKASDANARAAAGMLFGDTSETYFSLCNSLPCAHYEKAKAYLDSHAQADPYWVLRFARATNVDQNDADEWIQRTRDAEEEIRADLVPIRGHETAQQSLRRRVYPESHIAATEELAQQKLGYPRAHDFSFLIKSSDESQQEPYRGYVTGYVGFQENKSPYLRIEDMGSLHDVPGTKAFDVLGYLGNVASEQGINTVTFEAREDTTFSFLSSPAGEEWLRKFGYTMEVTGQTQLLGTEEVCQEVTLTKVEGNQSKPAQPRTSPPETERRQ